MKPENDQLIDISGDKMVLIHDGPSFAEPHDATIVHRSKINPISIWDRADPMFADAVKQAKADGINLEGRLQGHSGRQQGARLHDVDRAGVRPGAVSGQAGGPGHRLRYTNIDAVEDLTYGFAITNYGVNMEVVPMATARVVVLGR